MTVINISMFIYGSYALKHWFPSQRDPRDIDIILLKEQDRDAAVLAQLESHTIPIEITVAPFFETVAHLTENEYFTPQGLLTIKISHAYIDESWWKTAEDIMFLQAQGIDYDRAAALDLRTHWDLIHAGKRAQMNMKQTPDKFFNSLVTRYVSHDEIHDALRIDSVPAYTRILDNDTTVEVSKTKFEQLTHSQQLLTAVEEIAVLACERHFDATDARSAYAQAAHAFVTRMTAGWYNLFVLENLDQILNYEQTNIYENMQKIMQYILHKHLEQTQESSN